MLCSLLLLPLTLVNAKFDCKANGYEALDVTEVLNLTRSSPPSEIELTAYFNPCSPVKVEGCKDDDHLCVIETVKGPDGKKTISAIRPFGSTIEGASEETSYLENKLILQYSGATWGNRELYGSVEIRCKLEGPALFESFMPEGANIIISRPAVCGDNSEKNPGDPKEPGKSPDNDKSPEKKKDGGWGFFSWLFFLIFLALIGYAALTVYINFAQSRGSLPLGADISDVLRDLPYLIRDFLRKINIFQRRPSSSGYSAL